MELKKEIFPIDFDVLDVAYGLAGGALLGPYLAGVLIAHSQIKLFQKANLLMGTSVGAATGAVAAFDWKKLKPLWENIKTSKDVWKGDLNNQFSNVWGALFCDSILDPAPFYSILENLFGNMSILDVAKINDIELIFPAVNNNTHQLQYFSSFDETKNIMIKKIIAASAGIPIGLKSVPILMPDGSTQWFSDGGVGANNPFVSVHKYNKAFPKHKVKKLILIFCGGDAPAVDNKKYKLARDVGLNQIFTSLEIQEQVSNDFAEMITDYGVMDVCAIYRKGGLGDSMKADPTRLLKGYEDGVSMKVWDYRTESEIGLMDFIKRK